MAHITGGGILDNLKRILPANVDAVVDLSQVAIPPVFAAIREEGSIDDADMLRTFNLGVGLVCVCAADFAAELSNQLTEVGTRTRFLGEVQDGSGQARTMDSLSW